MKILRVRPCYVMDYELARITGQPGDLYVFDDASTESAPHRIPQAQDVVHTTFPRRGNLRGRQCHKSFWELYLRLLDDHGATHVFEVPPDTVILRPDAFEHPTADLVGVARKDLDGDGANWNQWGCGQMISRRGLELAIETVMTDQDIETVNHNQTSFQDVALSWLLRKHSHSLPKACECFWLRGDRPTAETAFVNFENFGIDMPVAQRREIVLRTATDFCRKA